MTKKSLKETLRSIVNQDATDNELNAFDQFLHYQQHHIKPPTKEVGERIWMGVENTVQSKKKMINLGVWLRVAASILIVFGVGLTYYVTQPKETAPEMVTVVTERGQKRTLTLHDGSTVKMNSGSSIVYPETFAEGERRLTLEGEAFFEIAEDQNKPFIISTGSLETKVLGTSFNVNARDAMLISVALVSGSVEVRNTETNELQKIEPGQLTTYTNGFQISSFDQKEIVAWKEGILYLKDASVDEVFEQLAAWYGVSFDFSNQPKNIWSYSGEFDNLSLELVLNTIGFSEGFEFKIENDTVIIEFNP
ncbi:MAG: FecR domain-containing protein [Bacteroidota bacterium]